MYQRLRYFEPMTRYREVLNPPLSLISFLIFMYISLAFAVWAAFDFLQAIVTMGLLLATLPFIWRSQRMVITVDSELRIDGAHIELNYLKAPEVLDQSSYRKLRTYESDARSFHATRPWLKQGVRIWVADSRDETTYWLIGSKSPEKLLNALKIN